MCMERVHCTLKRCWNVEVECSCITQAVTKCTGKCCNPVTKAVGVVMVLPGTDRHTTFAEPAALGDNWSLKLGPPLITPLHSYHGYLPSIFTEVLRNALPWAGTWLGQILGACAWLQVAVVSEYRRAGAMRAMHKAVAKAYACTPHAYQATTKVLHHISHKLPLKRCVAVRAVGIWLSRHAYWSDNLYSSGILPPDLTVDGTCGAWNSDFQSVYTVIQECRGNSCWCKKSWESNVCV